MATLSSFNKNNSAVKRIMQEARELSNDPSTEYSAAPLEDNLFEWHCTLRGAPETEFADGLYHFRIVLPAEYPFRPPSLMMLTPSGRFETNTKLCISFTNYHEELWQPAWGVRTAIIGLQGFFPLKGQAAVGVGSMEAPVSERKRLAKLSRDWVCPQCKVPNRESLPDPPQGDAQAATATATASTATATSSASSLSSASNDAPSAADGTPNSLGSLLNGASAEGASVESKDEAVSSNPISVGPAEGSTNALDREREGESARASAVEFVSASASPTSSPMPARSRPPLVLDAAISVLLVLVAALICRKLL